MMAFCVLVRASVCGKRSLGMFEAYAQEEEPLLPPQEGERGGRG